MEILKLRLWPAYGAKKRLRILMYHSISDPSRDRLAVSPELFAAEMRYLHERRFQVLSLEEGCRRIESSDELHRSVAITFDDGYRDFLTEAVPVLQRYRFPATLFVVTGGRQSASGLPIGPQPLLTTDEVRRVASLGFAIGSHTRTHAELTKLAPDALAEELACSYEDVVKVRSGFVPLSYPGGKFSDRVRHAAKQAGYSCAVIVGGRWGNGPDTDRFRLCREPMLASDDLDWFKKRVNGFYELHYLGARIRGRETR